MKMKNKVSFIFLMKIIFRVQFSRSSSQSRSLFGLYNRRLFISEAYTVETNNPLLEQRKRKVPLSKCVPNQHLFIITILRSQYRVPSQWNRGRSGPNSNWTRASHLMQSSLTLTSTKRSIKII